MEGALDTELKTYAKHRDLLLRTAEGKFVLIRHEEIAGIYESEMDAITQGYQKFGNVPFLVKQVVKIETPLDLRSNLLGV